MRVFLPARMKLVRVVHSFLPNVHCFGSFGGIVEGVVGYGWSCGGTGGWVARWGAREGLLRGLGRGWWKLVRVVGGVENEVLVCR